MTETVDFEALAAHRGPVVELSSGRIVGEGGTGTDYAGFADVEALYVEAKANCFDRSHGEASLTVLLEGSADGISWSTVETFSFSADGVLSATVTGPDDHLRVSWTVGGRSQWHIASVTAAPSSVNTAAGGGSQPFTPTDLDDLALWLDASTLVLADNAAVATWPDASGNGYDATQATANLKPVCKTAVLNGLRVVRFTASPDVQFLALSGAGLGLFRNLDACTIAVAAGNAVGSATNYVVTACAPADDTLRRVGMERHGDNVVSISGCNDDSGSDTDVATTAFSGTGPRITGAAVGTIDFAGESLVLETTTPPKQVTASFGDSASALPNSNSQKVYIGAFTDGSTGSDIDYAEILVYQRALNGYERRQVLDYLASKWATL